MRHPRLLRPTSVPVLGLVALLVVGLAAPAVGEQPADVKQGWLASTAGLRKAVTLSAVRVHQQAFQGHATSGGTGNRVGGSAAFEASASYVVSELVAAGFQPQSQYFTFPYNADRSPAVLQQVSPTAVTYVDGVDFQTMTYSPNGDVTAPVTAVDLVIPPVGTDNGNTSGCEAADFAGFPPGNIALIQRGTCTFAIKAANAAAAGASAVLVMNEGQVGRTAATGGTLSAPPAHAAPVVGTTFVLGQTLSGGILNGATGATVRVRVDRINESRTTRNVIAETAGGDPNRVVVVGAHLDSVPRGPGVNDNGSGSAAILALAEAIAARAIEPRNKIRFVWWGAEEFGLLGSTHYVGQLSQADKDRIEMNLNFDMIGSPNFVRFVYDGNNSAFPPGANVQAGPPGSGAIEAEFVRYFEAMGLASEPSPFNGRSDYGPFIAKGIPAGGLFTGAEGVKTAAQAATYGGTAGVAYDPCYHLACDTFANNSNEALDQMSDAVAHVVLTFAKRNFAVRPLVDPPVVVDSGAGGGGGLHEDDHEPVAS
jgi:Zn-dependent M28 family amino/carboxypeptidase